VIRFIKMNFVLIRVFVFALIYIAIIFVKTNAMENVRSTGLQSSSNPTDVPTADGVIIRAPIRRNQPCPAGEKRGPNGKCRKLWWGEIKIRFLVCLNAVNKAANLCLSKRSECYTGGELGFLNSQLLTGILICDIGGCHGVHCEEYDRNVINYLWFLPTLSVIHTKYGWIMGSLTWPSNMSCRRMEESRYRSTHSYPP